MMKRALMCLLLFSVGIPPAVVDARPPRDGGRGDGGRGNGEQGGGGRYEGGPGGGYPRGGYDDRRDADRPPPVAFDDRARRRPDQDRARDAMRQGARPLRDIQQQWRQRMPGSDYLGSDYDPGAGNYRLKFMRDGSVSWVDVDGRTGREIGRSPR